MELTHDLSALDAPSSLTPRQQEFCLQFVLTGNKAEAARQSGYARNNSSSIGCRLLQRQDIKRYIRVLRKEAQRLRDVPTPETLANALEVAENETVVSLASFFDLTGGVLRLRDPEDLEEHCFTELQCLEFDSKGRFKGYKLKNGGIPALTRMMRIAGYD